MLNPKIRVFSEAEVETKSLPQNLTMIQLAITDDNILKYEAECCSSKNIPICGFFCKFADLWCDFIQHKFH
jgi:hypothetical protein